MDPKLQGTRHPVQRASRWCQGTGVGGRPSWRSGGTDQDKRARKGQSQRSGGSSVVQEPPGPVSGVV